eukprot:gene35707-43306_t
MGSGASTLTTEQNVLLTKELREKYEAHKHNSNLSDEELHKLVMKDYEAIVEKIKKPKSESTGFDLTKVSKNKVEKGSRRIAVNVSETGSGKHSGGAAAGKSTPSNRAAAGNAGNARRRSFDGSAAKKAPAAAANLTAVTEAAAAPAAAAEAPSTQPTVDVSATTATSPAPVEQIIGDSWDSVTHQPYCNLCQMAFKSAAFLERHVKFSDLHQTNVKKAQGQPVSVPILAPTTTANPTTPGEASDGGKKAGMPVASKQVEGQHFKLLYTGSKFFWRTQDNVDLHFYHHILPHTIEVIPYDSTRSKELPRIYLNYTCLMSNVAKHHKQSTGQELDEDDNSRTAVTTYILQRLQLAASGASSHILTDSSLHSASASRIPSPGGGGGILMEYVKLTGDEKFPSPLLDRPPVVLIPILITRRRRTNAEEIDATINSLAADRTALAEATGKAEKIASLVYSSASTLASKKWWADFSRPRKLWIWGIRRVIRQKLVAETKKSLIARGLAGDRSRWKKPM